MKNLTIRSARVVTLVASIVIGLALGVSQQAAAESAIDPGFKDAMVEFLTIQNAAQEIEGQMTLSISQQALSAIAAAGIEITQPLQDIVIDVAKTSLGSRFADVNYLAELYAPLYAQYYSELELRELNTFWQSPLGKKTLSAMPSLTAGSFEVLINARAPFIPIFQETLDQRLKEAGIELAL